MRTLPASPLPPLSHPVSCVRIKDRLAYKKEVNIIRKEDKTPNMRSSMLLIAVASASIARVCAFTSSHHHQLGSLRQSTLQGTLRPDATTAISDALRISEEFGATSNEARVAWDIVEEIDSSDNSAAWGNAAFGSGGSDMSSLSYLR